MPHAIQHRLDVIRRDLAWQNWSAACLSVLALVLSAGILLGLLDFLLRYLDPGMRVLSSLVFLASLIWAWWRFVIPLLNKDNSNLYVAHQAERQFPQLHDRLSSSIEFLQQSEDDPKAGSVALRRAVVNETEVVIEDLPLESVVDRRPLNRALLCGGVTIGVLALLLLLNGGAVKTAAARLFLPLGSTEWPRKHDLQFRDPPQQLAVGDSFEIELQDQNGPLPDEVLIHYRFDQNGRRRTITEPMQRVGDLMVATRDGVQESFEYRATGGDDRSMPWRRLQVVEPPRIVDLQLQAVPPSYTGLSPQPLSRYSEVLAGSVIHVQGSASEPIQSARIQVEPGEPIDLDLLAVDGSPVTSFGISDDRWMPTESAEYWIEMENAAGLSGRSDRRTLRVIPDPEPTVRWLEPFRDLYLLSTASVPLRLDVRDNLRIQSVGVTYTRSDLPEETTIDIYQATQSDLRSTGAASEPDELVVDQEFDLVSLNLAAGVTLELKGVASDLRLGTGTTPAPRRITIITEQEFQQRLSDRLEQIIRQLEQGLSWQREMRQELRNLVIEHEATGTLSRDQLESSQYGQRGIGRLVADEQEGITAAAREVLAELDLNRQQSPQLRSQLQTLQTAMEESGDGPLPAAEQQIKQARGSDRTADALAALESATTNQETVIKVFEQQLEALAAWAGQQQFVRELAELQQQQRDLRDQTLQRMSQKSAAQSPRDLDPQSRMQLNQAVEKQVEITNRFDSLTQKLSQASKEANSAENDADSLLEDALDIAKELGTASKLREATEQLKQNHTGRAAELQNELAEDLEELTDILAGKRERELDRIVEGLQEAQRELDNRRNELSRLGEQMESNPEPSQKQEGEMEQQGESIDRLSRRMRRLQADQASRSTARAAQQLSRGDAQDPNQSVRQAEQDLAEAAERLAESLDERQQELARQNAFELADGLAEAIENQLRLKQDTEDLDDKTPQQKKSESGGLANRQRDVGGQTSSLSDLAKDSRVLRYSIDRAADAMQQAAEKLTATDTGKPTQELQQRAARQLEQISQALRPPQPNEPNEDSQQGDSQGQGGQQQQQNPEEPTLQMAELQLLRAMQAELKEQTMGASTGSAADLAARQAELAELVAELAARINSAPPQNQPADGLPSKGLLEKFEQLDRELPTIPLDGP